MKAIENLLSSINIRRKDTSKLFFNIYPFSLRAPFPEDYHGVFKAKSNASWNEASRNALGYAESCRVHRELQREYRTKVGAFIDDLIESNPDVLNADADYEYSSHTKSATFYLLEEEQVIGLLNGPTGDVFDQITAPRNRAAGMQLNAFKNEDAVIRNHLFLGEYEYKIDFHYRNDFAELDSRVENIFFSRDPHYSYGTGRSLYVADMSDLFLVKLSMAEEVLKITRCVLVEQ